MAWGRVTRSRNGAAECYSTNIRAFNHRHGGSYRSRGLKWEPKKAKINAKVALAPTTQSKTKKRVSFADPVASVLGEPPEVASAREKYMRPNSIRAEEIRKELEQNTVAAKNLEATVNKELALHLIVSLDKSPIVQQVSSQSTRVLGLGVQLS